MQTKRHRTPWLLAAGILLLVVGSWALQHTLKPRPGGAPPTAGQSKRQGGLSP
jgi:hypothetical protein